MSSMDDIFKNKLFDHEEEVPSDMWNNILAAQHEEKRRKYLFIWLVCGVLALAAIAGYWMYQGNSEDSSTAQPDVVSISENAKQYSNANNHSVIQENQFQEKATLSSEETFSNEQQNEKVSSQHHTSFEKSTIKPRSINNKNNKTFIKNATLSTSSATNLNTDVYNDSNKSIQAEYSNNKLLDHVNDRKTIGIDNRISSSMLNSSNLNGLDLPVFSLDQTFLQKKIQRVDCPRFNRARGAFFIEGLYGVNLNIKRLTSKIGVEGNSYLLKRVDSERALYSSSGTIKVGYQFPMGLSLASGVEYGQITERFSYEDLDAIKTKTVITFDTTFLSDGSFTTKADTFRIITHGSETTSIVNRYRSLDIPLSVAYAIEGKRLDVVLKASALFNVYFQPSGKVLGINDKPISIHNLDIDEGLQYTNRLKTRFDIAVGFNYHLNRYFDLIVEPYFKTSTGDITRATSNLSQSYTTFGLRTGIKYIIK